MTIERPSEPPEPPEPLPGRRPPERIVLPGLTLRRPAEDDVPALLKALTESFEHLHPWMPWAAEPPTLEAERAWAVQARRNWDEGTDYAYLLESPDGAIAGTVGLHDRIGPGVLEIGYWVNVGHTRRGYATRAAEAVTEIAFRLPGIERVEIHCDIANKRSAAVPPRIGYWLLGIEDDVREAPAEEGPRMRWGMTREAWARRGA
ncbi:GNAT family N-acetyltransferase [Actinomadura harenae]|uniref:N-acetyltransferase n=1 Tax=Actinomadura harenae TaxID=2483351 RepID=A0A3M2M1J5_9ACTN|nr:GNAT family N-acetyltransferase [Actinomadura harenae]RMI42940.1 N-acetyltransferase [Actinomadura harenae]